MCASHASINLHLKVWVVVFVQLLEGPGPLHLGKSGMTHTALLPAGTTPVGNSAPHWIPLTPEAFQFFLQCTTVSSASLMPGVRGAQLHVWPCLYQGQGPVELADCQLPCLILLHSTTPVLSGCGGSAPHLVLLPPGLG